MPPTETQRVAKTSAAISTQKYSQWWRGHTHVHVRQAELVLQRRRRRVAGLVQQDGLAFERLNLRRKLLLLLFDVRGLCTEFRSFTLLQTQLRLDSRQMALQLNHLERQAEYTPQSYENSANNRQDHNEPLDLPAGTIDTRESPPA